MAQNKNAQIRYKALDKCFSNRYKKFYINDLIDYCSGVLTEHYAQETTVSRRQIFDDMDFMRTEAGYDAPIESIKDGRKVFYRYSDPEFSILKQPLNPLELNSLNEALETLSRMNSIPGFDWVNSIQAKLQAGLVAESRNLQVISFEENEFLKGIEFLNPLYQNIINSQVLEIHYKSFTTNQNIFTISPYYLKQFNNRWFLFGFNHKVMKIQNVALDRIVAIEPSASQYQKCEIDFDEYFEDIVGVSNDPEKEPELVKIEVSANILPYITSKPLHGSQKINGNILTLEVKHNYELESLILSYGENMKVLEPDLLREKIAQRTENMKNNY